MINCLAIDDETLALDLLEDNIRQVPFLHLVKRCKNAYEAIEIIKEKKIDLVFLDLQMPGINGMQFLESLQTRPMVILITAFKQYALEGYSLDVLDYLVKPVPFERFLKATNKALEYYNLKNNQAIKQEVPIDYCFVSSEYNLVKIMVNEVLYIEGQKDYISIHVNSSEKPVVTRMSLKDMEEKCPAGKFMRVHKSFIVALDKITSIRANVITIGEAKIPIGDNYRTEFFNVINPEADKK